MRENFPTTWMSKEYKEHREKVLLDIEKARMPETQVFVDIVKQCAAMEEELRKLRIDANEKRLAYFEAKRKMSRQTRLKSRMENYVLGIRGYNNDFLEQLPSSTQETEPRTFIVACPMQDCRGFLSTQWKCGVCDVKICKECREPKVEEHLCDPNTKASVALMKHDSKPCPKCASMIYRIQGCDQMWCTVCTTAFSWRTGKVQTGSIHNPHYFQWIREHGGDPLNNNGAMARGGGGGACNQRFVEREMLIKSSSEVSNAYRLLRHLIYVTIRQFERRDNPDPNRADRVRYMMGQMSESEFKSILQKREKTLAKDAQIRDILNMFVDVCDDILYDLLGNQKQGNVDRNHTEELNQIRKYTNQCFRSVAKQYSDQTAYVIDPQFSNCIKMKMSHPVYKAYLNDGTERTEGTELSQQSSS
jgi:hypothetical protein